MSKNGYLKIIVLATVFGLGAGLVGQLFATAYLLPSEIFVSQGDGGIKKIQTQSEEVKKISEAHRAVSPTTFEIYPQKTVSREATGQVYLSKDRAALGFTLTSDGWLISFGRTLADPKNHFVVLTADQKIFSPTKIILDETTGTVFLKIDADNLPVSPLGETENLALGEKIIIPFDKQTLKISQIENLNYEKINDFRDLFKSSEKITKTIATNGSWSANEAGAPAVNLSGEVIGLSTPEAGIIFPINSWRPAFLSVLKNNEIRRPDLGIRYLDLSKSPGLSEALGQSQKSGALIWSDKNLQITGVTKNSPAAQAGLRDGDIITKIDEDEVNSKNSLAEIIGNYSPGDKIKITIIRIGEEKIIDVTLD